MTSWQASPFLKLCIALHGLAVPALLLRPSSWPWLLLALFLLHGGIALAGLLPRCSLLGGNLTRLPAAAARRGEVAITIDDGPDPAVTPAVLEILRQYQVPATFFCIGERALRHPELCRRAVAEGHDIENHGQRHRKHTSLFGPAGWRGEVGEGQATLQTITGRKPLFYRPIAGLRNPFLDPLLQRSGVFLASWTRRGYDTRVRDPDAVYARLVRNLAAGDILLLHDGNAARTPDGKPVILAVLPRLLEELAARQLRPVTLRQACKSA
ncbi:polysaccharide deacetylase family protein [Pseudogulbenkiania ferrooxidans]|uniref:Polysaccharide deacetylase n=1 Tax=Pseudogulbenkiania ferrooxidans 2002 TaxID=279714 RepID=B9Z736_9NEIS|nr:polysaccharide deacetylase family protein [Pseudogulbenkiania ferrooxidans]EEG07351.1 polysaccharide deacetylase [Pseudogulbenkiania ferrooxidans 2002]